MVFATGSFVNANTSEIVVSEVSEGPKGDCATDALNFGSMFGGSYTATDWYYSTFC
ncbi:hypothetical protein [Tenacibaculum aestuariivivum]|uniref:hypothetical protein n=1 Tax=Tenacibaculum aestuariivivum TaxID=2006131 RepID=UPI003AB55ECE